MIGSLVRRTSGLWLLIGFLIGPPARADDWAVTLGYPEDAKVVILHAHDAGLGHETNQAIAELVDSGLRLSTSAMAPCAWFPHAVDSVFAPGKDVDLGLQLTLNSEWPKYRWRPVSRDPVVQSLVDADGYLWRSVIQVAASARPEGVETELRAQLAHAERLGCRPTHFTTHLGALFSRPDLAELYLNLAREQWVPAVVVELTPEVELRMAERGLPINDRMARAVESYPLPKLKDLRIVPRTATYEEKVEATLDMLEALPAGLSQVAFAPGVESEALRAMCPDWQQYVWDRAVWGDDRVKAFLGSQDVVLTDWVEVMQRFSGGAR